MSLSNHNFNFNKSFIIILIVIYFINFIMTINVFKRHNIIISKRLVTGHSI